MSRPNRIRPRGERRRRLASSALPAVQRQLELEDLSQLFVGELLGGGRRQKLLAAEDAGMGRQLVGDGRRRQRRPSLLAAAAAQLPQGLEQPLHGVVVFFPFASS